jgi:hypothetical protein
VGPQAGDFSSQGLDKDAQLSSRLSGVEVVGVRDGSLGRLHFALLYLVAKTSHVGANIDELAYLLHYPMACG